MTYTNNFVNNLKPEDINWWTFDPVCNPLMTYHHEVVDAFENFTFAQQTVCELAGRVALILTSPLGYLVGGSLVAIAKIFEFCLGLDFSEGARQEMLLEAVCCGDKVTVLNILDLQKHSTTDLILSLQNAVLNDNLEMVKLIVTYFDTSQPNAIIHTHLLSIVRNATLEGKTEIAQYIIDYFSTWVKLEFSVILPGAPHQNITQEATVNLESKDYRTATPNELVHAFYRGEGKDKEGRTLEEILAWDFDKKEAVHNYIQWIFPTNQPSAFNRNAPVLTKELQETLNNDPQVVANLKEAFQSMLAFYGLTYDVDQNQVKEVLQPLEKSWATRSKQWVKAGDHNHLRITRILTALRDFGFEKEAKAFKTKLIEIANNYTGISSTTLSFWTEVIS